MWVGLAWGAVSSFFPVVVFVAWGFQAYLVVVICLAVLLLVFYLCNWFAPESRLHRRPAMLSYSRFYSFVLICLLAVLLMLAFDADSASCIAELVLLVLDLLQPFVMFRALQEDSLYWQGTCTSYKKARHYKYLCCVLRDRTV